MQTKCVSDYIESCSEDKENCLAVDVRNLKPVRLIVNIEIAGFKPDRLAAVYRSI